MKKFYNLNYILNQSQVFSSIIKDSKDGRITWEEIMLGFKQYYDNLKLESFSKHLLSIKCLEKLEKAGIDYDFKDQYGDNFLHYCLKNQTNNNHFCFQEEAIDYVMTKVENIYDTNHATEQIIVHYIQSEHIHESTKNFWKLTSKYPEFNYQSISSQGQNLLFKCLLHDTDYEIINFLIEKGADPYVVDNNGHNLLHMFFISKFNYNNKSFFSELIKKIDITQNSKHNKNSINTWLEFVCDKNTQSYTKTRSVKWLNFTFEKINNLDFLYTDTILENLKEELFEYKEEYLKSLYFLEEQEKKLI